MKFRPNADMLASVLVHLLLLALILLYSEVHQFDPVAADTMPVEVVTQQEATELKPEPTPVPSPTPDLQLPSLDQPTDRTAPTPAAEAPAQQSQPQSQQQKQSQKQKQAQPPKPSPTPQHAATAEQPPTPPSPAPQPQASQPQGSQPQASQSPMPQSFPQVAQQPAPQSQPAYTTPEPDISVKYHVMLGLPPDLSAQTPADAPAGSEPGTDNFDAAATEKADIGNGVVAEFRRHLKTCMKLPANLSAGDDVRVKLRVFMTTDGKLAGVPQLIEATASTKGPLLMRSATQALEACQPYAMLPKDRYHEWKVLDLDFTPRDFAS
jgi:outer membrane biosynthesis protein TonB